MESLQNVIFAGLLHDTDDRKYFPLNKNYENAEMILKYFFKEIKPKGKH